MGKISKKIALGIVGLSLIGGAFGFVQANKGKVKESHHLLTKFSDIGIIDLHKKDILFEDDYLEFKISGTFENRNEEMTIKIPCGYYDIVFINKDGSKDLLAGHYNTGLGGMTRWAERSVEEVFTKELGIGTITLYATDFIREPDTVDDYRLILRDKEGKRRLDIILPQYSPNPQYASETSNKNISIKIIDKDFNEYEAGFKELSKGRKLNAQGKKIQLIP